ncbi:MAG: endo-1,4-beta-xylanase [Thermoguttaceae bacterium]|jgi:endo-1,4-beta-xylanase
MRFLMICLALSSTAFGLQTPAASEARTSSTTLRQAAGNRLKVMITEMDIDVLPRSRGFGADIAATERQGRDPYRAGLPDEVQQKLADRYGELFAMIMRYPQVTRVTLWGISDGQTWLNNYPVWGRTNYPMLWDRQLHPKPAFDAVIKALQSVKPDGGSAKGESPGTAHK